MESALNSFFVQLALAKRKAVMRANVFKAIYFPVVPKKNQLFIPEGERAPPFFSQVVLGNYSVDKIAVIGGVYIKHEVIL